jgi:enoyl-CoA hydratase/carnithine racemase
MPVSTERRDKIFVITLDRPEAMNSIDADMHVQLGAAWDEFEDDSDLQVAILTGAGEKAFCAGRDLVKSAADPANDWSQRQERAQRRIRLTPDGIEKPVIAAVNGYCLAAGLGLALGCDLRVASENASFGTMAAKRGIVAGGGQTQRLARYMPFGIAMEMVMFGERIPAQRAYEVGLVNRLVPEGEALEAAVAWAEQLCENGPLAVRAMKQLLYEGGLGMPLADGLRLEARRYAEILETDDAKEGPRAFAEKRKAQFKGR